MENQYGYIKTSVFPTITSKVMKAKIEFNPKIKIPHTTRLSQLHYNLLNSATKSFLFENNGTERKLTDPQAAKEEV